MTIDKEQTLNKLTKYIDRISKPGKNYSGVQAHVYSAKLEIDWHYANGVSSRNGLLTKVTPYHVASIGKLFTATIIYQLAEANKLQLDDSINEYIDRSKLGNLFVYKDTDYTNDVTFRQLLSHTSGAADYFEGPVKSGHKMEKWLEKSPDKIWQPDELLNFSIQNQEPVSAPGAGYLYSDTGFILLGMLVESIEEKSFEQVLIDRFFTPLQMRDTYMAMRSRPLSGDGRPIADLWLNDMEYGGYNALSVDWSGGGIITTLDDLRKFSVALHSGTLISDASLSAFFEGTNKFHTGIYTGAGGMTVRFSKFFPLLKLPLVRGHIGILATHLFYDPTTDTHVVLNFGSTRKMNASFQALIKILTLVKKYNTSL